MSHPIGTADRHRFQRLEEVFDLLLPETTGGRERWLQELRHEDDGLAREVGALLAADSAAEGRFTDGLWVADMADGAATRPDGELPGPGDRLGAYRIVRPLGRGGMGRVFLARRDDGAFDGQVAVKLVDTDRRRTGAVVRFCLERRMLARLDHPHVARLLDAGATAEGVPFLVMEFVSGLPLDRHCRTVGADRRERLRLFLQLCAAVDHAHRRGLVHRDLKPANVLVTTAEPGAPPTVKLLDFGIAKPLGAGSRLGAVTTGPGQRWMSRAWASPEQLRGVETVGHSSDVYTLGIMLRYLLTDEPPEGCRPLEQGAVSAVGCGALELDTDCAAIIDRATELDPSHRYAGVDELARDLRRYLEHRPVEARGGGAFYRARCFALRHRALVAAMAVALVAVVGWIFHGLDQHRRLVAERDQALEMTRSFLELFEQPLADRGVAADLRASDLLEMGFRRLEPGLSGRPEAVRSRLLGAYASAYRALQRPERALELAVRALDLDPETPHGGWLRIVSAHALFDLGRFDEGRRAARSALDELRARDAQPALIAQALGAVGRGQALTEGGAAAEPNFIAAVSQWRGLPGQEVAFSDALLDLAWARFDSGAERDALELARQALEARKARLGDDHPEVAVPLLHLGRLEAALGRPRAAEPLLLQAWQLRRAGLGDDHPLTVSTHRFLTLALEEQWIDRYPELIRRLATQERLQRTRLGPWHPDRGETLMRLANARLHLGRLDAAVSDIEEAIRVLSHSLGDGASITHLARHVGAKLWIARGEPSRAEALAARVVAELPADDRVSLITLPLLARLRCDEGFTEQGLTLLDRARAGWEQQKRPVPWRRAVAEVERAGCLLRLGQNTEAATLLRRGLPEIEAEKGPESQVTQRVRELLAKAEDRPASTVRGNQGQL